MKLSARQRRWVVRPLAFLFRMLGRTWRVRREGLPSPYPEDLPSPYPEERFIDAFCHGHMLFFMSIYRDCPCVVMVSDRRDGQIIAEVAERFGARTARGSSTRGGARAFLDMLRNHGDLGWIVTPDGPRGPRRKVHEGIIKMASDSRRAIRPHGFAASHGKKLGSWDAFTIPYPLARVVQHVGDPLQVPPETDRQVREQLARELERRLEDASRQAEIALARWHWKKRPVSAPH